MKFYKSLPAVLAISMLTSFGTVHADILSPENVSESYWLPKYNEPNNRADWLQMHLKRFMFLAGKDGRLDQHDLTRQRKASDERTELRARLSFLSVDKDLDGTITPEEMKEFDFSDGAGIEKPDERFSRVDENQDGIVSEREWIGEGFRQQAKRDEVNHNYNASQFTQYWGVDPNRDNALTSAEYEAALGQLYNHYDQNKDGHLSKAEADIWQKAVLAVELVNIMDEYPELRENPRAMKLIEDLKEQRDIK